MQEDWQRYWAGRAQCYSHYPSSVVQIMLMSISIVQRFSSGSGTIFCGFAPSMKSLIAARAIAGMGGGGYALCGIFLPISNCLFSVMTGEFKSELKFL
jgi:MFS family permease